MSDPFPTTRWSIVFEAADGSTQDRRDALEVLCRAYWLPLYGYVRHRGYSDDDARDLVQTYFADLVERRFFQAAQPDSGRFRRFLLHTMKQFLVNEHHRATAQKRGAGVSPIALDAEGAERKLGSALAGEDDPEAAYERRWAQTVIARVLERMAAEAERNGRLAAFNRLKGYLTDEDPTSHRDAAGDLGTSSGAVKVAVHRLRRRFGACLRDEVNRTLVDPDDADDEVRHLLKALRC